MTAIRLKFPRIVVIVRAHAHQGVGIEVSADCGSYFATPTLTPADARALATALVQQADAVDPPAEAAA